MEVGRDPLVSFVNKAINLLRNHGVRAPGIEPVLHDFHWWSGNLSRKEQYVGDGNPDTVTIPKGTEKDLDYYSRLNGKKLLIY